jgi:hypothetical protein
MKRIVKISVVKFQVLCLVFLLSACGNGGDSGSSSAVSPSAMAQITSFNLNSPPAPGSINNVNRVIAVNVPYGTDVTNLTPMIVISSGAAVYPASGVAKDFTSPVIYTVTAEDKVTTQKYTVMVTVAPGPTAMLFDDFLGTVIDSNKWHIPTWVSSTDGTFVGQTQFRCSQNATLPVIINGSAIIALDTYNPTGASFYGTDLVSKQPFVLGQGIVVTVRAKMDAPLPAGIIGGIFLYAPPANSGSTLHDEIDFELLSSDPHNIHSNIYGHEPLGVGHPAASPYASGSIADYHVYQIQWLPGQVSWYVDGNLVRTVTPQLPIPAGPMYVHFNIWVPESDFSDAYNPNLHWASSAINNQTYSMSIDSVKVEITK